MPEHSKKTNPAKARVGAWQLSSPTRLRVGDGTQIDHPVIIFDGTPCLVCKTDPDEVKYYVPLIATEQERHEGAPLETVWVLPYDEIVPATFRGASLVLE